MAIAGVEVNLLWVQRTKTPNGNAMTPHPSIYLVRSSMSSRFKLCPQHKELFCLSEELVVTMAATIHDLTF